MESFDFNNLGTGPKERFDILHNGQTIKVLRKAYNNWVAWVDGQFDKTGISRKTKKACINTLKTYIDWNNRQYHGKEKIS